jgi:hypothetical protein
MSLPDNGGGAVCVAAMLAMRGRFSDDDIRDVASLALWGLAPQRTV